VVESDMRNGSGFKIQDQRDGGGMMFAQAHVGMASGGRFPAREFLAILHGFIEDIDWAAPDIAVLKFGMKPMCLQ
jgi:hypothetical protein